MAEFAYNNAKNTSTGHTLFELNYGFYLRMSYKEDVDPRSQSKLADELLAELRELMIVCRKNLYYAQELQNELMIRESNLGATLPTRKFG